MIFLFIYVIQVKIIIQVATKIGLGNPKLRAGRGSVKSREKIEIFAQKVAQGMRQHSLSIL